MTFDPLAEIPECGQYWKWEKPTGIPTGDQQSALIYQTVGMALSTWESVEYSFAKVFSAFMEANPVASERVFGALEGIKVKTTVLEQAAQAAFRHRKVEQGVRDAWKRLRGHYGEAADRRNEICHGQVGLIRSSIGDLGWFLMPRYNSKKATPMWESPPGPQMATGGYLYTSADIGRWMDGFNHLDTWALVFENEYVEKYSRRP